VSEDTKAPSILIPRKHQSAPKEHWAEREIREAAQEIVDGKAAADVPADEFWRYGETQTVAYHPRVVAAMAALEREMEQTTHTQEYLEKTAALHEMNEMAAQANCWDGQERWIGQENEESRHGELMEPAEFMRRLEPVVGTGRIFLNRYAVLGRVAILAPDPEWQPDPLFALQDKKIQDSITMLRNFEKNFDGSLDMQKQMKTLDNMVTAHELERRGQAEYLKGKKMVATLQYPMMTEWMIMKFDEYGVPTSPKYLGWRTALLSMISLGVITEKQAHQAFPLRKSRASLWYEEQLFAIRNRNGVVN
jgi:hypothetical protein